ncbi:unnamed protein product [Spodoptera littoralis]|uniref:Uncharacterized protein n=1 Tax=Spodoptera littoralis TaxID=7109 RepID=A0A9P0IGW9_SPOLI|nr:unnamed protein product [Spodoptera littoralis]CAH1645612.1 unnamed protein product [Spodoptera littoralis]
MLKYCGEINAYWQIFSVRWKLVSWFKTLHTLMSLSDHTNTKVLCLRDSPFVFVHVIGNLLTLLDKKSRRRCLCKFQNCVCIDCLSFSGIFCKHCFLHEQGGNSGCFSLCFSYTAPGSLFRLGFFII